MEHQKISNTCALRQDSQAADRGVAARREARELILASWPRGKRAASGNGTVAWVGFVTRLCL